MGRFALRNGPNRSAKRPISHGETAHFATQYGQVLMAACVPLCFSAAQMRVCLWRVWLKNRLVVAVCRNLLVTLFAYATQAAVVRMETRYGTSREQ